MSWEIEALKGNSDSLLPVVGAGLLRPLTEVEPQRGNKALL